MRVIVVGGGIIGALSAYYLNQAGAQVTLLEKETDLATHASGINAGQLAYCYAAPLGSPAVYGLLRKIVLGGAEDVRVTKWLDPRLIDWGVRLLRQSTKERYKANQDALLALTLESRELMAAFRAKHDFDFSHRQNGRLHLYATPEQMQAARGFAATLERHGLHQEFLTPAQCLEREPALAERTGPLAGGMASPADCIGDCRLFTQALKPLLLGVNWRLGVSVGKIHAPGGAFSAVETAEGERIAGDALLVCAGADSYGILKAAGLRVPLYPIKGFSTTLRGSGISVTMNVIDHFRRSVVFVPLGDAIRVTGFMYFSGDDPVVPARARTHFLDVIPQVFPRAQVRDPVVEAGFRPYLPTSVPVTGPTKVKGLYVNIGHNMLGWTLAHATCKRAAEAILK